MKHLQYFIFIIVAFSGSNLLAQQKLEKEYRIHAEEVSLQAQTFINSIDNIGKVKWYFEENLVGNSIEAKFKLNKKKYSVEFDTDGNLQDIEVITYWNKIEKPIQKNIENQLDSLFEKFVIRKIQFQYTGENNELLNVFKTENSDLTLNLKFELVVKGKIEKLLKLFEITLNQSGKFLQMEEIILNNSDHLEY